MVSNISKPVRRLVLDTNPIIKNEPSVSSLLAQAETLYTIPAVIDEIRDEVTRTRIQNTLLPFLKLRSPRSASIKIITDFARRTGDLEVLSRPDIHLMALTYELECEENGGDWRLRSTPGQKELNGKPPVATEEDQPKQEEYEKVIERVEAEKTKAAVPETRGAWGTAIPAATVAETQERPAAVEKIADALETTNISEKEGSGTAEAKQFEAAPSHSEDTSNGATTGESLAAAIQYESRGETESASEHIGGATISVANEEEVPALDATREPYAASEESEDSDDGGDWITPSNLKKHIEKDINISTKSKKPELLQVAIMTSDFAMQNVLLRMNLNILSSQLQRIRQLKSIVLRCHACFHVEKNLAKQFCDRCGKPTLLRVPSTTQADGTVKLHLKKNMQWNNRGNVYSIPKPVAGTSNGKMAPGGGKGGWGQSLILAGDQKEYIQEVTVARRTKERDLMDEDYLPGLLSGDRGHHAGRTKVGAGRNVNSKKRR